MQNLLKKSRQRIKRSLVEGFEYHHLATARSNKFLRKHDSERLLMYVIYVDLVGSTKMSADLSPQVFNIVIRTFSQEMAYVIEQFDGYVLKFVGDAVLGYFLANKNSSLVANKVIKCAKTMNQVVENAINPILGEKHYPKLNVKITMDLGKCSVIRYGSDKRRSHIDIIGLTLNLAAKMQQLAKPRQIIIGEYVYSKLSPKMKSSFKKMKTNHKEWKFHEFGRNNVYSIYSSEFLIV